MSWFTNPTIELDKKIEECTSESIPNGEIDVAVAFEITDIIRSKTIPSKLCMRSIKKRLTVIYTNPNLVQLTLKLTDLCVKNGGFHFLVELSSKEFMDYLIEFVLKANYNVKDHSIIENEAKYKTGQYILTLIKNWNSYFQNQVQLDYVHKCYNNLRNQGFDFEGLEVDDEFKVSGAFIDLETPADWVDSDECMICYKLFSTFNRKHHCRSCGGVYDQEHSSNSIPLPSLGILEPVRVCDNCYYRIRSTNESGKTKRSVTSSKRSNKVSDEDEDLKKAIELSLQELSFQAPLSFQPQPSVSQQPQPQPTVDDDDDEDMKAAIAASLKEFENQEKLLGTPEQESESEFYNNMLPTMTTNRKTYSQSNQAPPNYVTPRSTPPVTQDLSQSEEESINLYLTLINQLRNDTTRQANILDDSNLNELHLKVLKLKPKLNKSLRQSIEKYEHFVTLNNKILTITKLYDQFLEQKLSLAYGHGLETYHQNTGPYPVDEYSQRVQLTSEIQPQYQNNYQSQENPFSNSQGSGVYVQPPNARPSPMPYNYYMPEYANSLEETYEVPKHEAPKPNEPQYPSEPDLEPNKYYPSEPSYSNIDQYPAIETLSVVSAPKQGIDKINTQDYENTKMKYPPIEQVETQLIEEPLIEL